MQISSATPIIQPAIYVSKKMSKKHDYTSSNHARATPNKGERAMEEVVVLDLEFFVNYATIRTYCSRLLS